MGALIWGLGANHSAVVVGANVVAFDTVEVTGLCRTAVATVEVCLNVVSCEVLGAAVEVT